MTHLYAAGLLTLLASTATATTEDTYRYGRVRLVEPTVTLQRAAEPDAEEASPNAPFLPGDRTWSDANGRAEFQILDGSMIWIAARTKLDYASQETTDSERTTLRLWSGSLATRKWSQGSAVLEIETPEALIRLDAASRVRIDVERETTRVSVREGTAQLETEAGAWSLSEGQRTEIRRGDATPSTWRVSPFDSDEFDTWVSDRETLPIQDNASEEYLPEELTPYSAELQQNGSWFHEDDAGYVWRPRVAADWTPYSQGRWSWTSYGWTWIPSESWGWAPFHYGRWGFSVRLGWYWLPDRTWAPAWVSWALGNEHIGWCALDRWNRPIHHSSLAGRGQRSHSPDSWRFVRRADFASRDLRRRRVLGIGPDSAGLRIFTAATQRPARSLDGALEARHPSFRPRSASGTSLFQAPRTERRGGFAAPTRRRTEPESVDASAFGADSARRGDRSPALRRGTRRLSEAEDVRRDDVSAPRSRRPFERRERVPAGETQNRPTESAEREDTRTIRPRRDETRPARESGRGVMGRIFDRLEDERGRNATRDHSASASSRGDSGASTTTARERVRPTEGSADSSRGRSSDSGGRSETSRRRSDDSGGRSEASRGRSDASGGRSESSGARHPSRQRGE